MMQRAAILALLALALAACAAHDAYEPPSFAKKAFNVNAITLNPDGLTRRQVESIMATAPPAHFPVDVAVIVLQSGHLDPRSLEDFTQTVLASLDASDRVRRVTLIPPFLMPPTPSFSAIQELGVRSLSEYVLVFHLNAAEFFTWTKILETKYEITSAVHFILMDSVTSGMLTAERIFSTQEYESTLFELGERRKAEEQLFSEQAYLLAERVDRLLSGTD